MQSLAYMIEMKEQLDIVDYKGQGVGHINLEVFLLSKAHPELTHFQIKLQ